MRITITRDQFLAGLQAVQSVVGSHSLLPILDNVLLRAVDGQLELTCTNLDMAVTCAVPAAIEVAGATTISVKRLYDLVRELTASELSLVTDEKHHTLLKGGSGRFQLKGLLPDEMPPPMQNENPKTLILPQATLRRALKQIAFCTGEPKVETILSGTFLGLRDKVFSAAASDRRVMGCVDMPVDEKGTWGVVIPPKATSLLAGLLRESDDDVMIGAADNSARFTIFEGDQAPQVTLTTKLIEGQYPPYRRVILEGFTTRATVGREELLSVLRRAGAMATDTLSAVGLQWGENMITVSVSNPASGQTNESIVGKVTGGPGDIHTAQRWLVGALGQITEDDVTMDVSILANGLGSLTIRSSGTTYVIALMGASAPPEPEAKP